jgi:hypothetical protein
MSTQEKFNQFVDRFPHARKPFFERPHLSRRELVQVLGAGVTASVLTGPVRGGVVVDSVPVTTKNTAKNVIFILMAGAPSHTDTFDLKVTDGTTPKEFNPTQIGDLLWPTGLMPKMADQLGNVAIVRSMRAWAAAHQIAQHWVQIGRNPSAALGDIAPNIGSIIAVEKDSGRRAGQVLPAFLALNSGSGIGSGYLSASYDPMRLTPAPTGIPNTTNVDGPQRLANKVSLVHTLDDSLRARSPLGARVDDYQDLASAAEQLTYNPAVQRAFDYTLADSARYGSTSFGNACLLAQKVLAADLGTRFVQITVGGWDMHTNIYGNNATGGLFTLAKQFDAGVATMLADLKASGQLDSTLVVMLGEFGRTIGKLTANGGRDHFLQQFVAFAGAGVKGGRAIGATDAQGSMTTDSGWSRQRDIKPEDVEATIYSALGINWTNTRYDDPFGRGFEYVPFATKSDLYGPINELWG